MRKAVRRGLSLLLACSLWARAETLEQACARLSAADASVQDLSIKSSIKITKSEGRTSDKISLHMAHKVLREGDNLLFRTLTKMVRHWSTPDATMAGGGRSQMTTLDVFDGEFRWIEVRRPRVPEVLVTKAPLGEALRGGPPGIGSLVGAQVPLEATFKRMKATSDLVLVGRGSVLGRTTTIIQATLKPERLRKLPARARAGWPTKAVVQFDDKTGAQLAGRMYTADGKEFKTFKATELKVNTGLDRSLFRYSPPPGAKVIDFTVPPKPMPRR